MISEEVLNRIFCDCVWDKLTEETMNDTFANMNLNRAEYAGYEEHNGVSKAVFYIPTLDKEHVIKIPFSGYAEFCDWMSTEEYERAEDEMINRETAFYPFECARSYYGDDYCAAEENIYEEIAEFCEEENLPDITVMFAKTECVCRVNNYPIYQQPYCKPLEESGKTITDLQKSEIDDFCDSVFLYSCFNYTWLYDAREYYGDEMVAALLKCVDYVDINDLHSGNLGYTVDGRPIIFDYSGYNA